MDWIKRFFETSENIILGKQQELKYSLCCLLANGHLLIEDIPGVGKTTMVRFLSHILGLEMSRIQFTNDLLPGDIIGSNIFNQDSKEFTFSKGPIFSQVVLADELNRASPRTQSALLQVMEERRVSVYNQTFDLPRPFFVLATQNPREQIGTNPLPESQLDRFLMKISMGYPNANAEKALLLGKSIDEKIELLDPIINFEQLIKTQQQINDIHASAAIADYVVELLNETRVNSNYQGLSPRAGIDLIKAAKAWAYINDRAAIEPEDIQDVAGPVLGHRLVSAHNNCSIIAKNKVEELIQSVNV